jgi:hypothetical protein
VSFVAGLLAIAGLFGCSQETPAEKARADAASGNATTQASGQAAVGSIKTPMDQARQTESVLGRSAEQRAAQSKEPTQWSNGCAGENRNKSVTLLYCNCAILKVVPDGLWQNYRVRS